MSEQKPFSVEVQIGAPEEDVWRALTEPTVIREWFGWDYAGIDQEIQVIFVQYAAPVPPGRIEMHNEQVIELLPGDEGTLVRARTTAAADDDGAYDAIEEGWRSFFEQLRFLLERHPTGRRRTLYLTGLAEPGDVIELVDVAEPCHQSRFQRTFIDTDDNLVVVAAQRPLAEHGPAPLAVTVTTYGLDDAAFAKTRDRWAAGWRAIAKDADITT